MTVQINPAWEQIVSDCSAPVLQPRKKRRAHIGGQLELNWAIALLLDDNRSSANIRSSHNVTDPDLDQVTTSQLAIDSQVEQSFVSQSSLAIKVETDSPHLLLRQREPQRPIAKSFASYTQCTYLLLRTGYHGSDIGLTNGTAAIFDPDKLSATFAPCYYKK